MAVSNNGKIIRSLPEQVSRNTKRIDEIEAQKSLYLYVGNYADTDGSIYSFQFVANKGSYNFEDNYAALVATLKDNGTKYLVASGYDNDLSEQIILIEVGISDDIVVESISGTTRSLDENNLDSIYMNVVKIL